ncbi:response regulator [Anabaena sp. FACHB-709]|uniref:Two-component response regulator n=2 Tax=Nostocaceae TaxID=1162 RepID=A0A1Z4KHW7_ANAVA|nr:MULTISPECIES: response regulator [Nostocaceae]BAY68578.1 two-component response regulator [Trichormus variabilis NIES-23]HBW30188.1 response regulator [Nostoc sp. UBA8866]MBD2171614.1 response regulator [Anabaena cylindrica FACHB-318]MBD2262356.1 response regulator [Anabaena sp. FACHB-709]MBD2276032.1 response regulator [Nostoc sp. PCC 7120 = FACHB-418]
MSNAAILCVDDEVSILKALKEQLKRLFGNRYVYEVAQSSEEAWTVIDELEEDEIKILIIVSDWLMPNVRGDEFLIKVHQRFPEVITVMLTGQADKEAIERAEQQANLYACIRKPWTEEELKSIINSALKQ